MAKAIKKARQKVISAMREPWERRRVATWADYQREIERFLDGGWLFRGVASVRHPLIPSVGRVRHEFSYRGEIEAALFEQFKREALPLLPSRPQNDWEWLALAQHFGTPTRLLDWSETPYVSLFFAVWGNDEDDAGLYIVPRPRHVPAPVGSPFDLKEVSFFYPGYVTSRLVSQRGLFTVHPNPAEVYSPPGMLQIVVDRAAKADFRRKLDTAGIHHAAIYPDLDGLSKRLIAVQGYKNVILSDPKEAELLKLKTAAPVAPPTRINPADPQKGQWGGRPEHDGWRLSAKVTTLSDDWYKILLTVEPVSARKTLHGPVAFHLHDSFLEPVRTVVAKRGKAMLEVSAYGAFTVGVHIEETGTLLELDLAEVQSAPPRFRAQ